MRITYIFQHVSNNIIGRVGSVLSSISILIRLLMVVIFSQFILVDGKNSEWGYLFGAIFLILGVIPLILNYKKLINMNTRT